MLVAEAKVYPKFLYFLYSYITCGFRQWIMWTDTTYLPLGMEQMSMEVG